MVKIFTSEEDKICKDILKSWGYLDTINRGFNDYISLWESFVNKCNQGYSLTIDDYLNSLSYRETLLKLIESLKNNSLKKKIEDALTPIDKKLKGLLVDTKICVWGKKNEDNYKPKDKYWWYWGIVRNAKGELLEDLKKEDLFPYYKKNS